MAKYLPVFTFVFLVVGVVALSGQLLANPLLAPVDRLVLTAMVAAALLAAAVLLPVLLGFPAGRRAALGGLELALWAAPLAALLALLVPETAPMGLAWWQVGLWAGVAVPPLALQLVPVLPGIWPRAGRRPAVPARVARATR